MGLSSVPWWLWCQHIFVVEPATASTVASEDRFLAATDHRTFSPSEKRLRLPFLDQGRAD
jgi:hypothetical protein